MPEHFRVEITPTEHITAIAYPAARDRIGRSLLLAHGAGANQTSDFIVRFATGLAARGVDTITFNFLYTEQRKRLPDRNDKLEACYRGIIAAWHEGAFGSTISNGRLVIGGKSMGGRIASQVAASDAQDIAGLVLLGYPLHPPGKPEKLRTRHLGSITAPMLFVQGSRDSFGTPEELRPFIDELSAPAELCVVEGGDHSFKVPKRAALLQEQVYDAVLDHIVRWVRHKVADH